MGSPPSQQAQAIESQPIPVAAPPVTSTNAEVIQAQQDFAQQNLLKKSIKSTIMAGDSGGFGPGMPGSPGSGPIAPKTFKGRF